MNISVIRLHPLVKLLSITLRECPEERVYSYSVRLKSVMNMVAGVASTGKRVMMATSGPGISLGSEAISFMACAELPA